MRCGLALFVYRFAPFGWLVGWLIVQATRSDAPRSRDVVPSGPFPLYTLYVEVWGKSVECADDLDDWLLPVEV